MVEIRNCFLLAGLLPSPPRCPCSCATPQQPASDRHRHPKTQGTSWSTEIYRPHRPSCTRRRMARVGSPRGGPPTSGRPIALWRHSSPECEPLACMIGLTTCLSQRLFSLQPPMVCTVLKLAGDGATFEPLNREDHRNILNTDASRLFAMPFSIRRATYFTHKVAENDLATVFVLIIGLVAFAGLFAVNSSVHSYLIVSYSNKVCC